ncbi:aldo/keto reductase [Amycolatopsis sp. NBC_00348]|uniref:aldo/keto reductase n=1 Tax=Amycolatopsis sp. NBC_00348 TaxID=2975956 RepID=UPI002E26F5E9
MRTTILGSGLSTSALGLGCAGLAARGIAGARSVRRYVARAVELGVTMLDTADVYGAQLGENERLVGRAITRRSDIVVATKFGLRFGQQGAIRVDSSAEWARQACHDSLQRLGTDYLDLYYLHRRNADIPIEETVSAMAELVRRGDVRHIGLSEVNSQTVRSAHAIHPISVVQIEYSLLTRFAERELLGVCRQLNIGIAAYRPFGAGLLTGQFSTPSALRPSDYRRQSPRWSEDNLRMNLKLSERVRSIAEAAGCTPAQLALAWLWSRDRDIVPISGTTKFKHLRDNVQAAQLTVPAELLAQLEDLDQYVLGDRYSAAQMKLLDL